MGAKIWKSQNFSEVLEEYYTQYQGGKKFKKLAQSQFKVAVKIRKSQNFQRSYRTSPYYPGGLKLARNRSMKKYQSCYYSVSTGATALKISHNTERQKVVQQQFSQKIIIML